MGTTDFKTLQELEREHILKALKESKGCMVIAHNLLGIGRATLYRRLKEFDINVNDYRRDGK